VNRALGVNVRAQAQSRLLRAIALVSFAGMMVAGISLYHHFATSKSSFCDIGQSFNCDLVNRSAYSTLFGVPVALIGVAGYLVLLSLATVYRQKPETPLVLAVASAMGLCFALYLTYIEAHVLAAWCILCLSSLGLILADTILSAILAVKSARPA
jgi:vitamin-K-epoxide reductase (warfarin-sensitive)